MTNNFAVTRERQGSTVGARNRTGAFHHPAHRALNAGNWMRQRAAHRGGRRAGSVLSRNPLTSHPFGLSNRSTVSENSFYRAIDLLVVDQTRLRLSPKRSAENARKAQKSGTSARQAAIAVVVAKQFAAYAEDRVTQF